MGTGEKGEKIGKVNDLLRFICYLPCNQAVAKNLGVRIPPSPPDRI